MAEGTKETQLIAERKKKLEQLREAGVNPFPYEYNQTHHAKELQTLHASLKEEEKSGEVVQVAGRVMLFRHMGKLSIKV